MPFDSIPIIIRCIPEVVSDIEPPAGISSPSGIGSITITLSFMDMEWRSIVLAASLDAPVNVSASAPLFTMVK